MVPEARAGAARAILSVVAALAILLGAWPITAPPAVAADPYTLETHARYDIRPGSGRIRVRVALELTNTTPDPAGRFSVFREIRIAVHDEAVELAASDDAGALGVADGFRTVGGDRVHVATVELRQALRFNQSVSAELTYVLPDGDGRLRVRPSLVAFPAWSFGTSGRVSVTIPAGYEMRVDGDPLTEEGDQLVSGPIDDPAAWLAQVVAVRPTEFAELASTVPLEGGTADLLVRAFGDDEAWGERTLEVVSAALPRIEAALGLPYPVLGRLVLTESVALDASGLGEGGSTGTQIAISYEQPPFTALHQVVHAWLPSTLVQSRWIVEGLASHVAATVGAELDIEPPYDPAAEAEAQADAAFPLDAWPSAPQPEQQAFGYAASWDLVDEIIDEVGADALRAVLSRVAASIGPYDAAEVSPKPGDGAGGQPLVALSSRSFLDQLEAVTDADFSDLFAERVLSEADAALLEQRAAARAEFEALVAAAHGWGAPDPVRAAMAGWRFEEAADGMAEARDWLASRDELLAEMSAVGLSAPDRLQQAYRAYGGGSEADAELTREAGLVDAYAAAATRVNGQRSFLQRLGLVGGPDPDAQLVQANGRFTDGDLAGAAEAVTAAESIVGSAEAGGIVRLVSLLLVVLIVVGLVIVLFRRRAYTAAR